MESRQFLTLQHFTCELRTAISADLTKVAEKLFSKRVISQAQLEKAQLSTIVVSVRASELVTQVVAQVKVDLEKFDVFLEVLEESDVPQKVVTDVREKYESFETPCDDQPLRLRSDDTVNHYEERLLKLTREKEELERDKESLSAELEHATSAYDERRKRTKEEFATLRRKLQEKDAEIHDKEHATSAYDEQRKRTKEEITTLRRKLQEKDAEIHGKEHEIKALQNKLALLHNQLEEIRTKHRELENLRSSTRESTATTSLSMNVETNYHTHRRTRNGANSDNDPLPISIHSTDGATCSDNDLPFPDHSHTCMRRSLLLTGSTTVLLCILLFDSMIVTDNTELTPRKMLVSRYYSLEGEEVMLFTVSAETTFYDELCADVEIDTLSMNCAKNMNVTPMTQLAFRPHDTIVDGYMQYWIHVIANTWDPDKIQVSKFCSSYHLQKLANQAFIAEFLPVISLRDRLAITCNILNRTER